MSSCPAFFALVTLLAACNPENGSDNQNPTADAGEDLTAVESDVVSLSGLGSDPDGVIAAYAWSQVAGPEVGLDGATNAVATFVAPPVSEDTVLTFQLTVTDDQGGTGDDTVDVTVSSANVPPVADAGLDATVYEGTTVGLAGTATDSDGTVATTTWGQVTGPGVVLSDPSATTTTFAAPPVTEPTPLTFRFTAIDDDGGSHSDDVVVTVLGINADPTADAGDDRVGEEKSVVAVLGFAEDSDGTIASVLWAQVSGSPAATIATPTALSTDITLPDVSANTQLGFRLTVTDNEGGTASDEMLIDVTMNAAPTAEAGEDQTGDELGDVTLTGYGTDTDGTIEGYSWAQTGGPASEIVSPAAAETVVNLPAVGTDTDLQFTLTVTDDDGNTGSDTVAVHVRSANLAPVVEVDDDFTLKTPADAAVGGTAGDSDGSINVVQWDQTQGPVVSFDPPDALDTVVSFPQVASETTVVLRLSATDDRGAVGRDTLTVTLLPPNVAPTAHAGDDRTVATGSTVNLTGWGDDDDGDIVAYEWEQIGGPMADLVFPDDPDHQNVQVDLPEVEQEEVVELRLTVTDDDGATGTDTLLVTVRPYNPSPTADVGEDRTVVSPATVEFVGHGTDTPPGEVVAYQWSQIAGAVNVAFATPTDATTDVTFPTVQSVTGIVLRLTVTDDEGATGSDDVQITLYPPNKPPVANAGPDQEVLFGSDVALDGTGSTDSDGTVVAYSWAQIGGTLVDELVDAETATPSFTAPVVTVDEFLSFELTVEDDDGATDTDIVQVFVWKQEYPPTVDAGPDQDVLAGANVVIEATVDDPDGQVDPTITWTQTGGPAVELYSTDNAVTGFIAPSDVDCAEWVKLEISVTDDQGYTATDEVAIFIVGGSKTTLEPNFTLDFETPDQVEVIQPEDAPVWERGVPAQGPGEAWSGTYAYGTDLDANTASNRWGILCLPAVDLTDSTRATFSMRAWVQDYAWDGLAVQVLDPSGGWTSVPEPNIPYQTTDPSDSPVWNAIRYQSEYKLVTASLDDYVGGVVHLRLTHRTNCCDASIGAFVDDVAVWEESGDADGDGLAGILDEIALGGDPFVVDTDGDGVDDHTEVQASTAPDNPAWTPATVPWTPGMLVNLETDPGGLTPWPGRTLWEFGPPGQGPASAHSEGNTWGTNLDGYYFPNADEHLYLPPFDLSTATEPTFSFYQWSRTAASDGLSVEVRSQVHDLCTRDWCQVEAAFPATQTTDPLANKTWTTLGYRDSEYVLTAVDLSLFAGELLEVRLAFRTNSGGEGHGVFIDDPALYDEAVDDPDGDGLMGVITEYLGCETSPCTAEDVIVKPIAGTDPFTTDSDGDTTSDGAEALGVPYTDPLDPADRPGVASLGLGTWLTFDADDGGLRQNRTLWQLGGPSSGLTTPYSPGRVWGTNLSGYYFSNALEYLYLPPLDLEDAAQPILSVRWWSRLAADDGVWVEASADHGAWVNVSAATPAETANNTGAPALGSYGYRQEYVWAAWDLSAFKDATHLRVRFAFRSNSGGEWYGVYIDDLRLDDNVDKDGDGVGEGHCTGDPLCEGGLLSEVAVGTDPYGADSDGDGEEDGYELDHDGDPLNGAVTSTSTALVEGDVLTFEADDGGLWAPGTLWEHGPAGAGPETGYGGSNNIWATRLDGYYFPSAEEPLYLPRLDLTGMSEPTLSFRIWNSVAEWDGMTLEYKSTDGTWIPMTPAFPEANHPLGRGTQGFPTLNYRTEWVLAAYAIDPAWATDNLLDTRIYFYSNSGGEWWGTYIDDLALLDDDTDQDGDTLLGVIAEYENYTTDGREIDSDFDGTDDATEVNGDMDPHNPADHDTQVLLHPGDLLTFDEDDGGLATGRTLWKCGATTNASPPRVEGNKVWATNLGGYYFASAREYLYLPPIDLTGVTGSSYLDFLLWSATAVSDGTSIEYYSPDHPDFTGDPLFDGTWVNLAPVNPAYDGSDGLNNNAWNDYSPDGDYGPARMDLTPFNGGIVRLRFAFRSNGGGEYWGAYVDDLEVVVE